MYLRAKYTKYKMAKTKFSIWRYIICEICKKNGSNRPFLASRVADTIFPPPIEGHHRQLDNQCKDPMDNNKDCRVGQLTTSLPTCSQVSTTVMVAILGRRSSWRRRRELMSNIYLNSSTPSTFSELQPVLSTKHLKLKSCVGG